MLKSYNDPFDAILALQHALESRRESDWMAGGTAGVGGYPPINVFQQRDDVVAFIELPGIDKADLQIEAKDNAIRISGVKAVTYEQQGSLHRRERLSGRFDRTL